jgi:hypothetical protein
MDYFIVIIIVLLCFYLAIKYLVKTFTSRDNNVCKDCTFCKFKDGCGKFNEYQINNNKKKDEKK